MLNIKGIIFYEEPDNLKFFANGRELVYKKKKEFNDWLSHANKSNISVYVTQREVVKCRDFVNGLYTRKTNTKRKINMMIKENIV
jgi:hypothetical protein